MLRIGSHAIASAAILVPMAGVSDLPFQRLCRRLGAGLACGEMLTAQTRLWRSAKSRRRLPETAGDEPRWMQIAGADPAQMAQAARACVDHGAQIVDINMGCPAKKVCRRAAGSALLADVRLVRAILHAVVGAVAVPVTLKIRTGIDPKRRNGPLIARLAEDAGVQALTVHGRTRACGFTGAAEYDTIAEIVRRVRIPVFANGDIATPAGARRVLAWTGAAGVAIGRGAWGQPWLFRALRQHLATGEHLPELSRATRVAIIRDHICALHDHYQRGEDGDATVAVRLARKHMGWYLQRLGLGTEERRQFNAIDDCRAQLDFISALAGVEPVARRHTDVPGSGNLAGDTQGLWTRTGAAAARPFNNNNKQEIAA